jgi:ABC-type transporter Mla subunit MlaD
MKFLSLITFASAVLAAPAVVERQGTPVDAINGAISTLDQTVTSNIQSIQQGLDSLKGAVDPAAVGEVTDTLKEAFDAITAELKKATGSIVQITGNQVGGLVNTVKTFTQKEVDQVSAALKNANKIIADLQGALQNTAETLTPEVKKALQAEIGAAKAAINPFVSPLTDLGNTVVKVLGLKNLDLSGVKNGLSAITGLLKNILSTLGLGKGVKPAMI